jgi:hypothetical protein
MSSSSKSPYVILFVLGTAVWYAGNKGIIEQWVAFGLLLVLSLVVRVMLQRSTL